MFELKLIVLTMMLWSNIVEHGATGDPQTRVLNRGCSTYNASNVQSFHANINATFSELRGDIINDSEHFGTTHQATGDVLTFVMFQCRNYLSKNDCLSCFNTAATEIRRNCSTATGARVVCDGCFLRYISSTVSRNITVAKLLGIYSLHRLRLFTKTYMLYAIHTHISSLLSNEFTS
ncbi:hypothetical protein VNO80_29819 [Phaseolus coccineus]|uniref:Gnk2-homologous domain-containing protein n=1 Tax=Phaseolus coccineus TaxID=3886 RepID=A0AAN9LC14_PHACN